MKKQKSNMGITLIALVITIIVLLILAGVTIMTLTGENGILGKSQTSAEETNKQTATEIMNLKITNAQIESYTKTQTMPTLQFLADAFYEDTEIEYVYNESQKTASKEKIKVTGEYIYTKLEEYPYEFQIDGDLKLASIDGIKVADSNASKIEELTNRLNDLEQSYNDLKNDYGTLNSNYTNLQNEVNSIKPISVSANSLLMTSLNENNAIGEFNLSNFTNTFKNSFNECFTFNQSTGELTCKKDGWYSLNMFVSLDNTTSSWSYTTLIASVNGQELCSCSVVVVSTCIGDDASSTTLFLKTGDKMQFKKTTGNYSVNERCKASINLLKL